MFNKTIDYEELASFFDGKVRIKSLKLFSDERGYVCETFRLDSDITHDSKMCYISETKPYVMRGPHEHVYQRDEFISWKNNMVYVFYDIKNKKSAYFTTDSSKIINVSVEPGIVHSYRNLDSKPSFTMNFPTSLFMGENKKEEIDEIRHEHKFTNNKTFIILGSNGRLGKSLTNEFFGNMGFHSYDVIPVDRKINNPCELYSLLNDIEQSLKGEKGAQHSREVVFINCCSFSNVQEADKQKELVKWVNADLPLAICTECAKRNWQFVQFSSDYVYQSVVNGDFYDELGSYTQSKKLMEDLIRNAPKLKTKNTLIIRLANLYSDSAKDVHNIVGKLYRNVRGPGGVVKIVENTTIMPTNVRVLSKLLYDTLLSRKQDGLSFINVVPDEKYKLEEFLLSFFGVSSERIKKREKRLNDWSKLFIEPSDGTEIMALKSSGQDILDLISALDALITE